MNTPPTAGPSRSHDPRGGMAVCWEAWEGREMSLLSEPSGQAIVRSRLPLAAEEAWALVTEVRNHARWVPLTRIEAAARLAVGDVFTAVTGPGARRGWPGLPDRMVVEHLTPPDSAAGTAGRATYRKLGPLLLGTAEVHVLPDGGSSVVVWTEDVHLRGLPRRLTAPPLALALGKMLRVVVGRLDAEVTAHGPSEPGVIS